MPTPRSGETRNDFVARCMADAEARRTFPNQRQRLAFCESTYDRRSEDMSEAETKVFRFPTEIKQVDAEARTFEGLASTWDRDLQDDIIERGAFRKTLSTWRKGEYVIPLLDSHDTWSIRSALGRLEAAQEREAGLWTRWKVVSGADGDGALDRIGDGIVDALSIGYRPVKWDLEEDEDARWGELRRIKELELKEVSLVMFPANPGARISAVKQMLAGLSDTERKAVFESCGISAPRLKTRQDEPEREPPPETPTGYSPESATALANKIRRARIGSIVRRRY